MALPLYLAMTAAEFQKCSLLPEYGAWMACHYSPYGLGLSNLPRYLPEGAMLILNDRTPARGHDPECIACQLQALEESLHYKYILLDFQRPDSLENASVAKAILSALSCPVGVSESFARELTCPVFLPPPPPHVPLAEHLATWQGREIWLEAALESEVITVTEKESTQSSLATPFAEDGLEDTGLHCRYRIRAYEDRIDFTLWRTGEDLFALLREAEALGVTLSVGLWQELNGQESIFPTSRLQSAASRDIIVSTDRTENKQEEKTI